MTIRISVTKNFRCTSSLFGSWTLCVLSNAKTEKWLTIPTSQPSQLDSPRKWLQTLPINTSSRHMLQQWQYMHLEEDLMLSSLIERDASLCTFLQPRDLKALRLACHELQSIASKYLLETVYLDLLPDSFDRLLSASAHPTLCRYVRIIFYVPVQSFSCTPLDEFR